MSVWKFLHVATLSLYLVKKFMLETSTCNSSPFEIPIWVCLSLRLQEILLIVSTRNQAAKKIPTFQHLLPRGRRPLRLPQMYYAALDAFAGLEMLQKLRQLAEEKGVAAQRWDVDTVLLFEI